LTSPDGLKKQSPEETIALRALHSLAVLDHNISWELMLKGEELIERVKDREAPQYADDCFKLFLVFRSLAALNDADKVLLLFNMLFDKSGTSEIKQIAANMISSCRGEETDIPEHVRLHYERVTQVTNVFVSMLHEKVFNREG